MIILGIVGGVAITLAVMLALGWYGGRVERRAHETRIGRLAIESYRDDRISDLEREILRMKGMDE